MLLWFRNDLRTHDNPALHHFIDKKIANSEGKALFFISEKQWIAHDWSPIKVDFYKRHAYALVNELKSLNIELKIVSVDGFQEQISYLKAYCQLNKPSAVFANSELEFNEQQRDLACLNKGIPLSLFEADVVVPKGKVLNQSNEMYKVFSPFKRAWIKYVTEYGFEYLNKENVQQTDKENATTANDTSSPSASWPLASEFELYHLPLFIQQKLSCYAEQRDIPSIKATSGLSAYLAAGVISVRYVLITLLNEYPDLLIATDTKEFSWLNEIIWREFYRNLMFHEQKLCKHYCFKEKYQLTQWNENAKLYDAWCEGNTGYPLVDAAMRQLNQTGWMHNRLRMVVASFLTKHLLIDWRLGEKYFMQHLIDGDLASNNGGWQWAASTGCDAQPYFRIFNPIRQSKRFDPNGDFIRKYLPELHSIPDKHIHFPHQYIDDSGLKVYVKPIVIHEEARLKAIAFYK